MSEAFVRFDFDAIKRKWVCEFDKDDIRVLGYGEHQQYAYKQAVERWEKRVNKKGDDKSE